MLSSSLKAKSVAFSLIVFFAVVLLTMNLRAGTNPATETFSAQILSVDEMDRIAGGATCRDENWDYDETRGDCLEGANCIDEENCGRDYTIYSSTCSCTNDLIQNDFACETYTSRSRSWHSYNCMCVGANNKSCRAELSTSSTYATWCRESNVWCGTIQ